MEKLKFRKAKHSDTDRCFEIWLKAQEDAVGLRTKTSAKIKADFSEMFLSPRSIITIVENPEKTIVGWQGLFPVISHPIVGKRIAHISTYLDTNMQTPDLGKKLTAHSISLAKKKGIENVYGWVKSEHKAMNRLGRHFTDQVLSIKKSRKGNLPDFNLFIIDTEQNGTENS